MISGGPESGRRGFFGRCSDTLRRQIFANRTLQASLVLFMLMSSLLPAGLAIVTIIGDDNDAIPPLSAEIAVSPVLSISHAAFIYGSPGVLLTIYINVTDTDGDLLTITWDWGDGTANDTYQTTAATRTMVPRTHAWNPAIEPGTGGFDVTYTMVISVDDGTGNVVSGSRSVIIQVPENIGPYLYVSAPSQIDPMDNVTIMAAANDTEGESLTWTFVYNDSVSNFLTVVNITPATLPDEMVWNNQSIVFGAEGNYTVAVSVSDALGANQFGTHNNTQVLMIRAVADKIPTVTIITIEPSVLQISETKGYLLVNYSIEAQDSDGDVLNATWDFGDGSAPAYNESAATTEVYKFAQQVNYSNPGTFNVSVVVTDGRPGHELVRYSIVEITSNNLPPSIYEFLANYSGRSAALPNQTVNFTLVISDPELNAIEVIVDFGDNTSRVYFNLTEYLNGNVTIAFNHSYALEGNFTVEVWYTDNRLGLFNHSKEYNITVVVNTPPPIVKFHYTWWDYASMGLFAMIPVLMIVGYLRSRRTHKEIEAKGMSMDEWKLFQTVMDDEENKLK